MCELRRMSRVRAGVYTVCRVLSVECGGVTVEWGAQCGRFVESVEC